MDMPTKSLDRAPTSKANGQPLILLITQTIKSNLKMFDNVWHRCLSTSKKFADFAPGQSPSDAKEAVRLRKAWPSEISSRNNAMRAHPTSKSHGIGPSPSFWSTQPELRSKTWISKCFRTDLAKLHTRHLRAQRRCFGKIQEESPEERLLSTNQIFTKQLQSSSGLIGWT